MTTSGKLQVEVRRHLGSFLLDAAFQVEHWPAVLFGPSGAGKSSLLRVLGGLDSAESGKVVLDTRVVLDASPENKRGMRPRAGNGLVQLVSQRPALFPFLNVRENVAFGLHGLAASEKSRRVDEMLTLFQARSLAQRHPGHLSGGEQQRVALARALATQPKLLLLDEAFSGLDGGLKQEILHDLTCVLEERGVMALHVTHDVSDAFSLAAEVVVMQAGRVVGQGPVREVLAGERERLLGVLG